MTVIGLLSPGSMGAAVGACAIAGGAQVRWVPTGRSEATVARAAAASLDAVEDLATLAAGSDVVLSVCPPHAAVETAEQVTATGFTGIYVDANAIAPSTAARVGSIVAPATFVDGGIVGGPPREQGTTRLYLAGDAAPDVAAVFAGSALEAVVLDADPPAASALKVAYAAWTKGTSALLLTVRAYAASEGVEDALVAEWTRSLPELPHRSSATASRVAPKAWRWIAEMEEIASALEAAGLPGGFHTAAADVYTRLRDRKDTEHTTLEDATAALLRGRQAADG
jgi:3-hydroxyisobutyrate dehydrogenase-like beta-hydroxyacid dehydrogenase